MFIFRNEFNGAVVYDRENKDYFWLDSVAAFIVKNKNKLAKTNLLKWLKKNSQVSPIEYMELLKELKEIGLLGARRKKVVFLENKAIEGQLSAPLRVFYDITFACNFNCKHCGTDSGQRHKKELTLNQMKEIPNQMKAMGTYRLSIAGGEPLVCPSFFEFVKYARDLGIDVSVTTNGSLINKAIAQKLSAVGLRTITVSIDGATKEINDLIRGEGTFDKATKGVRTLRKHYPGKIAIRATLMQINIHQILGLIKLAENLNCDVLKFHFVRVKGRVEEQKDFWLNQRDYVRTVKRAARLSKKAKVRVVLPVNPFGKCEYYFIKELGFGCVGGRESLYIDPCGSISPCWYLGEDFIDGNIKTDRLQNIWIKGKHFQQLRNLKGNKICNNCKIFARCRGGCRQRALIAGDINGIDPWCFLGK